MQSFRRDIPDAEGKRQPESDLEQDGKPFLREMSVMGEDFGNAFGSHRLHGNAIREAVFFIGAGFVECETIEERLMGLGRTMMPGLLKTRSA